MSGAQAILDGADQATEVISGTVMRVISSGQAGSPWRGIIMPANGNPVFLAMDIPPAGLSAGDDLHFRGERLNSGSKDFPDHVKVLADDTEMRIAAMAASGGLVEMEASQSQDVPGTLLEAGARLGLSSLIGAASEHIIRLTSAQGAICVVRSRAAVDPVISWTLRRFSDPATAHYRAPLTMFVEPTALIPNRPAAVSPGLLQRFAAILSSARTPAAANAAAAPGPRNAVAFEPGLPAFQSEKNRALTANDISNITVSRTRGYTFCSGENLAPDMIIPYSPFRTGENVWFGNSGLNACGNFMPKKTASAYARARISSGHEMGHAHQDAFGYSYVNLEGMNACESFADAVGILCYVTDTGDVDNAIAYAAPRAMGALTYMTSHAAGPAGMAAVAAAADLRAEYEGSEVPLEIILRTADEIARKHAHPHPDDLSKVIARVSAICPGWSKLSVGEIAAIYRQAVAETAGEVTAPEATAAYIELGLDMLPDYAFTPSEMDDPLAREEALQVVRDDLIDNVASLRRSGLGSLIPALLRVFAADSGIDRNSRRQEEAGRKILSRFSGGLSDKVAPAGFAASALKLAALHAGRRLQLTGTEAILADGHRAVFNEVAQDYIVRGTGLAPRAHDIIAVSPVAQQIERCMFDLPLSDRMHSLGAAVMALRDQLEVTRKACAAARPACESHLARLVGKVRSISWSLRVDSDAWAEVVRAEAALPAMLGAIENIALAGANRLSLASSVMTATEIDRFFTDARPLVQEIATAGELRLHAKWRSWQKGGERLDWSNRDLRWLELSDLDLVNVTLDGADTRGLDLGNCRTGSTPVLLHDNADPAVVVVPELC